MKKSSKIITLVVTLLLVVFFAWWLDKFTNQKDDANKSVVSADEPAKTASAIPSPSPTPTPEEVLIPSEDSLIPILMYHHVKDWADGDNEIEQGLSVPIADFEGQMKALSDAGYKNVTLDKLFFSPQDKKVALTFDDGYDDNLSNAAPILKKYGLTATLFVTTDFIGTPRYMSWDDLKKMVSEYGWTIGAHTKSHPNLTGIGLDQAMTEIAESKNILESNLGVKVLDFSYPAGAFDAGTVELVKTAGYNFAVTTQGGSHNYKNSPYELKRIRINGGLGVEGFKNLMELP